MSWNFENLQLGNPLDEEFWEEYTDTEQVLFWGTGLSAFFIVALLVLAPLADLTWIALMYSVYLLVGITFGVFDYHFPVSRLENFIYFGDSKERVVVSFFAGIILFLLYLAFLYPKLNSGAIALPLTSASLTGISLIFFILGVAVYAEEKFFRMCVLPTITIWFDNQIHNLYISGWISNFLQAMAFGVAHAATTGFSYSSMQELAVFGFIAGILIYVFKSAAAPIGFHFARNFMALHGQGLI